MNDKSHAATPANATPDEPKLELICHPATTPATATPETVGERLKRVYPEHYVRIITEANRQHGPEHIAQFLSKTTAGIPNPYVGFLYGAFLWENSQEGHSFWAKLAEREG